MSYHQHWLEGFNQWGPLLTFYRLLRSSTPFLFSAPSLPLGETPKASLLIYQIMYIATSCLRYTLDILFYQQYKTSIYRTPSLCNVLWYSPTLCAKCQILREHNGECTTIKKGGPGAGYPSRWHKNWYQQTVPRKLDTVK